MPGPLQGIVLPASAGKDRPGRAGLVRPVDPARPRHRHGVIPARATFGDDQVVPAVAPQQVRPLGEAKLRAGIDDAALTGQGAVGKAIFLQDDTAEMRLIRAMVPQHVEQIGAPVFVVKQRWIEAAAVEPDRVGPVAFDRRRRHQAVMKIAQGQAVDAAYRRVAIAQDDRIGEIENPVLVRQARRPDAAAVGYAAQIQLRRPAQRPADQAPMDEVARMVDLDAREPFEGRGRYVIVVTDANDRRIGIEALENRIADHGLISVAAPGLISDHRTMAPTTSNPPIRMKNGP